MSAPSKELISELYHEDVRDARKMSPEEKLAAGAELFDYACEITKSGIRMQHPEADEEQVAELLLKRLDLRDRLERPR